MIETNLSEFWGNDNRPKDLKAITKAVLKIIEAEEGMEKSREEKEIDYLSMFINHGDCVIDVGANFGTYSVRMSDLVGDGGVVVAFEPYIPTFDVLTEVLKYFESEEIVQTYNIAIDDIPGLHQVEIVLPPIGNTEYGDPFGLPVGLASIRGQRLWKTAQKAHACTIDDFTSLKNITFVKIDVEGAELKVIKGMTQTIAQWRPVIMAEVEDRHLVTHGSSIPEFRAHVHEMGYEMFALEMWGPDIFLKAIDAVTWQENNHFLIPREKVKNYEVRQ